MAVATYVMAPGLWNYTPGSNLNAGDIVDLGTFVGITFEPIAAGVAGTLMTRGIFDINKKAGDAVNVGDKVYFVASANTVTITSAGSDAFAGVCVRSALAADTTVRVEIYPS